MIDADEVFGVADGLHAEGKLVSVRTVRASLARGGSNRDLGPLVRDWKAKRGYRPRVEVSGVPTDIQNRHGDALAALWDAACVAAARKYDDDRVRIEGLLRANDEVRDEALREVDRLTDEMVALRVRLGQVERMVESRDARLDRVRSEEFWDRVMMEVFDLLPAEGDLHVEEILPRLRPSIHRESAHHKEDVTVGVLQKKMMTRVAHRRYFHSHGDGRFGRRVGQG